MKDSLEIGDSRVRGMPPLHQPVEAEAGFASGSSQTLIILVFLDARKSFATSRQMSA